MSVPDKKYWFKRKKYGYGWTPASREGWFVTLAFVTAVLFVAFSGSNIDGELNISMMPHLAPLALLLILFLIIVYKTGEKPQWQWGDKKKDNNNR